MILTTVYKKPQGILVKLTLENLEISGNFVLEIGWTLCNYIRQEYGTINGVDSFHRAVANINAYNDNHGKILAKLEQTANGETCVAICDNFNGCCHGNLPQEGDLMLVDATSNLDRQGTKLFHIMTPSVVGTLPLGILISTREDEETMKFGFELYKSLLPESAFLAEVLIWDRN